MKPELVRFTDNVYAIVGAPGDRLWLLKEQAKRPKGCVRKCTVINL